MKSDNQNSTQKNNTEIGYGNKNSNECINNLKGILGSAKLSESILQKCLLIE